MKPSLFAAGLAVLLSAAAPVAYGETPSTDANSASAARLAMPLNGPMPWANPQVNNPAAWRHFLPVTGKTFVAFATEEASRFEPSIFDGTPESWRSEPGARSEVPFCCDATSVVEPTAPDFSLVTFRPLPIETLTMR